MKTEQNHGRALSARALLATVRLAEVDELAFDPDQLRDRRGRWVKDPRSGARPSEGGGAGAGGSSPVMLDAPSTPTPAPAAPKVDRTAPARAAAKARRAEDLKRSTDPKDNAAKVRAMVENEGGYADLYRRAEAGPSGQKRNIRVGRAEYVDRDRGEYRITDGDGGDTAGWATREYHNGELMYVLHSEDYEGGLHLVGWADTLSLGTDVLINGIHAATGRHDSRRTSGGKFEAYKPKPLRDEV